jgi:hypothetical protein
MTDGDPQSGGRTPRVSCATCAHGWFGTTAAHGLAVLGHCPRCGGELTFRRPAPSVAPASLNVDGESSADLTPSSVQPWQVLGTPTTWDGH